MLALIILFLTGLAALFLAFAKKPWMVLLTSVIGLSLTAGNLICQWNSPSDFLSSYQGVQMDHFAIRFAVVAVIFSILLIVSGYEYFKSNEDHTGDYIALIIFSLLGAVIMVSYQDMFLFFLGLEILSIPIYVMAGSKKADPLSSEASLKYFMTGAFATGVLLFGIAWLYGATGSFKIDEIGQYIATSENVSSLVYVGMLMILAAFLFKIGAAPFHFWSPDVYDGAPSVVTGFMAAVVKIGAFGAFIKMFTVCFGSLHDFLVPALTFLAMITMFVGNLSAIRQTRFKRLLAYSSIAHVGYSLITMVALTGNSVYNLWYYLLSYGLATIVLITVLLIVNDDEDRIDSLKGLARTNPFLGVVSVIALLALAGVPPLMGFFGKYLIFADAIKINPGLIIVALLNSGIGIYYYIRVVILILQKTDTEPSAYKAFRPTVLQTLVLLISTLLLLCGGTVLMY